MYYDIYKDKLLTTQFAKTNQIQLLSELIGQSWIEHREHGKRVCHVVLDNFVSPSDLLCFG